MKRLTKIILHRSLPVCSYVACQQSACIQMILKANDHQESEIVTAILIDLDLDPFLHLKNRSLIQYLYTIINLQDIVDIAICMANTNFANDQFIDFTFHVIELLSNDVNQNSFILLNKFVWFLQNLSCFDHPRLLSFFQSKFLNLLSQLYELVLDNRFHVNEILKSLISININLSKENQIYQQIPKHIVTLIIDSTISQSSDSGELVRLCAIAFMSNLNIQLNNQVAYLFQIAIEYEIKIEESFFERLFFESQFGDSLNQMFKKDYFIQQYFNIVLNYQQFFDSEIIEKARSIELGQQFRVVEIIVAGQKMY
ncbi:Hypothetical_protein [Hexamita inflata]|uniref:Hypothetical_protein n=1 Tax=Hexamita inflata TaxID=28002 RepID=A0AA86PYR8_9EUKA|nr:Hypothetical protein HINF_LOCUS30219 [Hexamita inflata]